MRDKQNLALKALLMAATVAILGWASVLIISWPVNAAALWLPTGFIFAMLVRSPKRHWPLLLLATAIGAFIGNWMGGRPLSLDFAYAAADTLQVLPGAWIATRVIQGRMELDRIPDVLALSLGAFVNGAVSGPIGAMALSLAGASGSIGSLWMVWSASNFLSHLLVAPLLLAWPKKTKERTALLLESLVWTLVCVIAVRWGLHRDPGLGDSGFLVFLAFPIMVLAALRTGPWGAAAALTGVSIMALLEGARGHGIEPFQYFALEHQLAWLQLFIGSQAVSILILASAAAAHRRAEGSFLESESRYRALVEQFPDAILLRDGSRIRYANPSAVALFGAKDAHDIEGRSLRDFIERRETISGEHSLSGTQHRYTAALRERVLKTISGRELPVEVTDISISLTDRGPLTLDVFRDLSKRRAAEEALRRSELDFQQLFDLAPMPLILTAGADGAILRGNLPARTLFEMEGEDIEQLRATDFYARPDDRSRLVDETLASGRMDGQEIDILTRKGRLRRVLISMARVTYQGQEAVLSGLMDVTIRLKTEEALRQAQKLESLGLMAGGVAHDFNNLLTALIGNLELARLTLPELGAAEPYFDAMAATLRRAGDLARQMLAYAGQAQVEIRPVDLNASIRELTSLMSASMSKKIELRFDLAEGLPAIEADPVQLQQVLLNLVTNAGDAIGTQAGAITLRSSIVDLGPASSEETLPGQEMRPGPAVLIEVEDTGCGMSRDVQARIFDPFFTTKASGRGLGLSTLIGILKAHHAGVKVLTEAGKGTRFRLYFPLPEKLVQPKLGIATGPYTLQGFVGEVLLVDDEGDIRMTAGAQLRRMGFEVLEAADGLEAVEVAERVGKGLLLVILDLSMPRMDGAEALARIRERRPDLPIILSSGFDPNQRTPELLKQPRTWFLPKPYRLAELRNIVAEVMATIDAMQAP